MAVSALVALTLPPAILLSAQRYGTAWQTPKWVRFDTAYLVVPAAAALVVGSLLGRILVRRGRPSDAPWPALAPGTDAVLGTAFLVCSRIAFAAYGVWAGVLLARGITPAGLVSAARTGQLYGSDLDARLEGIAGITTFTQVGIVAVTIGAVLDLRHPSRQVRRSVLVLMALALARSYLFAERLALIELVLPWIVVQAAGAVGGARTPARRRRLVLAAPLIALPLLFVTFAGFELSRSWTHFSAESQGSYSSFAADRLLGYYTTSYNNGQALYDHLRWPGKLPYYSAEFFWSFPVVEALMPYDEVTAPTRAYRQHDRSLVLDHYTNPEFNSPNGLISPAIDFGPIGGVAFLMGVGVVIGAVYESFRRSRVTGLLLYPVAYVGLLEVPRELYWLLGRTFPALVAVVVILVAVGRRARQEQASWRTQNSAGVAGG